MSYHYTDESRESDPHALPNVEVFWGYAHHCHRCETQTPLSPDYYGLLYPEKESCPGCERKGTLIASEPNRPGQYWYAYGFPGCLWDSEPIGPFDSEEQALAAAREECEPF